MAELMHEDTTDNENPQEPSEGSETSEVDTDATKDAEGAEKAAEGSQEPTAGPGSAAWAEVPDFAQKEVSDLRQEAAQRRLQVKELKEQLEGAKTQEDLDKAVAEFSNKVSELEATLTRERAGRGLSEASLKILANVPVEQVEATAESLRALEGAKAEQPKPEPDPNLGDPLNAGAGHEPEPESGADVMRSWRKNH